MKKAIVFLVLFISVGIAIPAYANLPTDKEKKCICVDGEIKEVPKNSCVDFKVKFGRAANEQDIDLEGFFHLYAQKPSPTIFSPQGLQYHNLLLNRIYKIYRNAKNLTAHQEYLGDGVYRTYYTDSNGNRFESDFVATDLPQDVIRSVKIFTINRELMTFDFHQGQSFASEEGVFKNQNFTLIMKNENGEIVTDDPHFFDMYFGNCDFIRYSATSGAAISYNTVTGRKLLPTTPSVGLDAIFDVDGTIRQVFSAADGLADIVVVSPGIKYEIRLYSHDNAGIKQNGYYVPSGNAHTVWIIENTVPGQTNSLRITKISGDTQEAFNYQFNHAMDDWLLTYPDGLGIASKANTWDYSRTVKTEIITEKTPDGNIVFKKTNTIQKFPFGDKIVFSTVDPDGANQRTSYTYTNDGKDESISRFDGDWTVWAYDNLGRIIRITRPWKNAPFRSGPEKSKVTYQSYSPVDSKDISLQYDTRPRVIEEKILDITTSKIYNAYFFNNDQYHEIEERCVDNNAQWQNSSNLRTIKKYYSSSADAASSGRLESISFPDGQLHKYTYEFGNWHQATSPANSYFASGNGAALKITIMLTNTSSPNGVPFKTTRKIEIYDSFGNLVKEENQIFTGENFQTLEWKIARYNNRNQKLTTIYSNGLYEETTWNCCNKESYTDLGGIQYVYTYDALHRLLSETKIGSNNAPNLVTQYSYDPMGRNIAHTITDGSILLNKTIAYDVAGNIIQEKDTSGLVTQYSYINGINSGSSLKGFTKITILPGNINKTVSNYCDGRIMSITGNAQTPEYYDYGVNSDGSTWSSIKFGGADSPCWEKVTTNMVGNNIKIEKSGFQGSTLVNEMFYNIKGQLAKTTSPESVATLLEYDELGNNFRTGLDVDGNGLLELASDDNIKDKIYQYSFFNNAWWKEINEYVYGTSNDSTATLVARQLTRLTDYQNGITSEEIVIDIAGNETVRTIKVDRATKTKIEETKSPGQQNKKQIIYVNDLQTQVTLPSNSISYYLYDGLGREIACENSKTGNSYISYYQEGTGKKGKRKSIVDPTNHSMTWDYDTNTGKMITETSSSGLYNYYEYNSHGKVTRKWGNADYPVEFEYDIFNRKVRQTTFRNGDSAWHAQLWPQVIDGESTIYSYDSASGLLTAITDPQGNSKTFFYSPSGKVLKISTARNSDIAPSVISCEYSNVFGRVTKMSYPESSSDVIYTYSRLGLLKQIDDAVGSRFYQYNNLFLLSQETIQGLYDKTLNYQYDNLGRRIGINNYYSYSYDNLNRISGISSGEHAINYFYNADDNLVANIQRSNGVNTYYTYEHNRDFLTQIKNQRGNAIVSQIDYETDANGRKTAITKSGNIYDQPIMLQLTYNTKSELTAVTSQDSTYNHSYAYDNIGNMLWAMDSNGTKTFTVNNNNEYTNYTENNQDKSLDYDKDGNLVAYAGWSYTWNSLDQLAKAQKDNLTIEFMYDWAGRRVSKKVINDGTVTSHKKYVYDDLKIIEELDGLANDTAIKRYVWQPKSISVDVPVLVSDLLRSNTYYYITDDIKNVTEIIDDVGNVVAHYNYSPFGKCISKIGEYAQENPFRFNSEYYDEETGLTCYLFRYFNHEIGKWLSRDPLGQDETLNLTAFSDNNPISYYDDLGLAKGCTYNRDRFFKDFTLPMPKFLSRLEAKLKIEIRHEKKICVFCCTDDSIGGSVSTSISGRGSLNLAIEVPFLVPAAAHLAVKAQAILSGYYGYSAETGYDFCKQEGYGRICESYGFTVGVKWTTRDWLKFTNISVSGGGEYHRSCKKCDDEPSKCRNEGRIVVSIKIGKNYQHDEVWGIEW